VLLSNLSSTTLSLLTYRLDQLLRRYRDTVAADEIVTERLDSYPVDTIGRAIFKARGRVVTSAIFKLCEAHEQLVATCVATTIPSLTPTVYCHEDVNGGADSAEPASVSRFCYVLFEDLSCPYWRKYASNSGARFPLMNTIAAVARLHSYWAEKHDALKGRGIQNIKMFDPATASRVSDLLSLLATLCDVPIEPQVLSAVSTIAGKCGGVNRDCSSMWSTLVHGDCHQENVLFDSIGRVKLIDWALAGIGLPQYDLVFYDTAHVDHYLSLLSPELADDHREFKRCLRVVTVQRMFTFLLAATHMMLSGGEEQMHSVVRASIPVYLDHLLRAANESDG